MKKTLILIAILISFAGLTKVYAETPVGAPSSPNPIGQPTSPNPIGQPTSPNPIGQTVSPDLGDPKEIDTVADVLNVIDRITNWMFTIFLAAAVIMILYAAFTYLTSGGGEETAKAHKMILYAAVAIAVAILAKGIVNVVKSIVTP